MLYNSEKSYGKIAKILHWLTGVMIIILLFVGFYMTGLANSPDKFSIYKIHKASGVILLILVLFRIYWRLNNTQPEFPDSPVEKKISRANFNLLYAFMIIMPVSGLLMSLLGGFAIDMFGIFTIPALDFGKEYAKIFHDIHGIIAYPLAFCIILHLAANTYHQLVKKDNIIKRML